MYLFGVFYMHEFFSSLSLPFEVDCIIIVLTFHRRWYWGKERLNKSSKATWLESGETSIQAQAVGLQCPHSFCISCSTNIQNTFSVKLLIAKCSPSVYFKAYVPCSNIAFCLSGPCTPNPCHNGGTCEISEAYRGDTFIGYVCKCPRGFNGIHCQHSKSSTVFVLLLSLIAKYASHYHSCLE